MNSIDFNQDDQGLLLPRAQENSEPLLAAYHRQAPLISQVFAIARRRRWEIVVCVLAAMLVGIVTTFLMTPRYTATAVIEIKREEQNFADVDNTAQAKTGFGDQEYYETQYGLLRSASLAQRVASDLRLQSNASFFEMMKLKPARNWFVGGKLTTNAPSQADRVRVAGNLLLRSLVVNPRRLSSLVEVSYSSPDAGLSKRVVDMWSQDFVQVTLERRYDATSYARTFLEGRLQQLRTRLDESEREVVDYAAKQGIVNLPAVASTAGQPGSPERSLLVDNLAGLNQELTTATAERVRAQSRLGTSGGTSTEALTNNAITTLREKRAELAADYAKLMVQFEPAYPPATLLRTQIAQMDQAIAREEARVGVTLQQTYRAAAEREQSLRDQIGQLQGKVLDLRRRSIQYNIYVRAVDTNRQLYDALLQRYTAIGIARGVGVNNISVVDPAELPGVPSSPKLWLNLAIALGAGLLTGVGLAFALEQIDQGIGDPSTVETLLGAPLLGTIPRVTENSPVDALKDPKSAIAEAYLSLRTNLGFTTSRGIPSTLAVTSSGPAEGKTTTSYALASAIARTGERVILIDADMRSPSIHHRFEIDNDSGLSNYLSGSDEIAPLVRSTTIENLSVMTAGPMPPSAPELLAGDRILTLMEKLQRDFRYVLLDAPPVMGLADAPLICSRVKGTVFVVETRRTHRSVARVAIERLLAVNVSLVGIVLTKFDMRRAQYGYGYGYGYEYGYGNKGN